MFVFCLPACCCVSIAFALVSCCFCFVVVVVVDGLAMLLAFMPLWLLVRMCFRISLFCCRFLWLIVQNRFRICFVSFWACVVDCFLLAVLVCFVDCFWGYFCGLIGCRCLACDLVFVLFGLLSHWFLFSPCLLALLFLLFDCCSIFFVLRALLWLLVCLLLWIVPFWNVFVCSYAFLLASVVLPLLLAFLLVSDVLVG